MVPGAYDTLTARLVQVAGFDAVYLTGGGYSRANGYPDIGLITHDRSHQWISRTVDAVDIPVIADMDAGYGNALNVIRSVREYEKTGVAAFHLEDQVSPKKCGHYEGKQIVTQGRDGRQDQGRGRHAARRRHGDHRALRRARRSKGCRRRSTA